MESLPEDAIKMSLHFHRLVVKRTLPWLAYGFHEAPRELRTARNESQAQFSADGLWLPYSADESGRMKVYVEQLRTQSSAPGRRWQVSSNGGTFPR